MIEPAKYHGLSVASRLIIWHQIAPYRQIKISSSTMKIRFSLII